MKEVLYEESATPKNLKFQKIIFIVYTVLIWIFGIIDVLTLLFPRRILGRNDNYSRFLYRLGSGVLVFKKTNLLLRRPCFRYGTDENNKSRSLQIQKKNSGIRL